MRVTGDTLRMREYLVATTQHRQVHPFTSFASFLSHIVTAPKRTVKRHYVSTIMSFNSSGNRQTTAIIRTVCSETTWVVLQPISAAIRDSS